MDSALGKMNPLLSVLAPAAVRSSVAVSVDSDPRGVSVASCGVDDVGSASLSLQTRMKQGLFLCFETMAGECYKALHMTLCLLQPVTPLRLSLEDADTFCFLTNSGFSESVTVHTSTGLPVSCMKSLHVCSSPVRIVAAVQSLSLEHAPKHSRGTMTAMVSTDEYETFLLRSARLKKLKVAIKSGTFKIKTRRNLCLAELAMLCEFVHAAVVSMKSTASEKKTIFLHL